MKFENALNSLTFSWGGDTRNSQLTLLRLVSPSLPLRGWTKWV